ncbi:MAG: alpha/beta hydrolase [Moraxellaceae bacterium]|nr:MAG: alpha/beta hydrolase [Moraxellaceae bacterium]
MPAISKLFNSFPLSLKNKKTPSLELFYKTTPDNKNLIQSITQLQQAYRPTFWLANTHVQLMYLELKKKLEKPLVYDRIDTLTMADGGKTALAWYGDNLSVSTPTIVILHTLTGSPHSMQDMVKDLHDYTGWRVVVAVRRGHGGLEFDSPRFSIFGSTQDLREQLIHIEQRFPESPLYAIGSSAGSGLLVRYLGEEQQNARFKASFAFCPGYNTDEGFKYCHPLYSKYMARKLIKTFIEPHQNKLQQLSTLESLKAAKDLLSFQQQVYEFSGFNNYQDYSDATNPMNVFQHITSPLMILNAVDDPVCNIQNLEPYLADIQQMDNIVVVKTRQGSHCAYQQGWQAKSWAHQLMAEYFQIMHQNAD